MRADRLLSIMLLLQAKGRATERELAERLEVSQRTIHRDLEALSAARVPVLALRGAQGGWELERGWRTEVPGLDEAELRALLMAKPRVVGHPRLAAAAESALNKLMASLPGPMREQAEAMRERLHVDPTGWRDTGEDLSMLTVVQEAVARERRLTFTYTRADGQRAERTVDPLGLVAKGLSWYLVARAPHGMRTYKVSRIEAATVLAMGFERPGNFKLAAYWERSTAELKRLGAPYRAVLAVAPEVVHKLHGWIDMKPVKAGMADDVPEGWVTLQVNFDAEGYARFVALGFGSTLRVVAPAELKQWVRREVEAMAKAG
jgi:predicted DNA-binding transcriptional regulator YafY